ncbi:helix-turn-helix domain-containing protein [Streptomyces phaeochromogenes]|uniref:Helix-turn-helix domain-containing protein n=1 Tax=Streptomyces phaeochromogenes TaxID=1923 RepID=A0ABZ1H5A2_STRPH|nr:helix-turn-helix domain-containing protein [Streptomyces phaeochromogenes]MCX5600468.1 helix-turn-helix domain-containing protein [Streptomyces phaeochromogenes]WRZ28202.1 helix-turn-helix domain-containing protein [Streptomyces phaeochromogenes]WSD13741.1 helix-turn-helix domain-containing protein [Streptomyces phaeochromogenes]WSJ09265.1 helix-turn-helix domain-containing protein [Streptomyces phaeochromogenes]
MGARRRRTGHDWKLLTESCTALLERLPELVDEHMRQLTEHSSVYGEFLPYDQQWREAEEAMRIGIQTISAPRDSPRRDLEYAEEAGRRRAQQGLPLELLVHAYRAAGYLVWDALMEEGAAAGQEPARLVVLMRSATMVWSAVDAQAAVATEAYRATEMELRRRTDERLQALLDALLEGQEAPGLAARAAAGLDLPERGPYAVVVLRSERRERESYRRPVEGDGFRFIWRMRADCEVGVVALTDGQGLDGVARALDGRCSGPGGISPVVAGLAELGRARRLAELALRTCPPDATAVVRLDQRMPTALVVSQPELAGRLVSDVFGSLLELEPADRAVLLETLDAWLACEGSAGRAAGRLYCHRNTVFNRLRRLEQLTSRSLARPRDLIEMTLALDAYRLS